MFNACNEITNWSRPQVITIVLSGSLVVIVRNRIDMCVPQAVCARDAIACVRIRWDNKSTTENMYGVLYIVCVYWVMNHYYCNGQSEHELSFRLTLHANRTNRISEHQCFILVNSLMWIEEWNEYYKFFFEEAKSLFLISFPKNREKCKIFLNLFFAKLIRVISIVSSDIL